MQTYQEMGIGVLSVISKGIGPDAQVRSGASTTAALVLAETEDGFNDPPTGSIYLSTAGIMFIRIASNAVAADWVPMDAEIAETAYIVVSKSGNDTTGNGSANAPLLTITAALAAVTSARKTVMVQPGTYDEAAALVWPTISGVKLVGVGNQGEVVISASAGDQVIDVVPGAQAAAFDLTIQGVRIDHNTTGQDGLDVDNTDITEDLTIYLGNVGFLADSGSDNSIITDHADATAAIKIFWNGENGNTNGDVYLDAGNAGDEFVAENVLLLGGMETAADATAFVIALKYSGVLHEGVTGGNAAQTINTIGCYSLTGTTYAALDTSDLAGSHTENIVSV